MEKSVHFRRGPLQIKNNPPLFQNTEFKLKLQEKSIYLCKKIDVCQVSKFLTYISQNMSINKLFNEIIVR